MGANKPKNMDKLELMENLSNSGKGSDEIIKYGCFLSANWMSVFELQIFKFLIGIGPLVHIYAYLLCARLIFFPSIKCKEMAFIRKKDGIIDYRNSLLNKVKTGTWRASAPTG